MRWLLPLVAAAAAAAPRPLEVPFFPQQKNGCGAASVAMVMRYWQPASPAPDQVYRRLYLPERKGIPLAEMRRYLEQSGFRAFTLRGEWRDVEEHLAKGRPIIVGLKKRPAGQMHFAVVVGLDGDYVWLNDPTRKQSHRVRRRDFRKQWNAAERWMLLSTPAKSD